MITLAVCGVHHVPMFAASNLTDMISIGDPDTHPHLCSPQPPPDFTPFPNTKIHRFEFQDICHEAETSPSFKHVQRILDLADSFMASKEDVRVLFHCQAGISRSTASAFILCVRTGMSYEDAYNHILSIRGVLSPNILMIKYADILMKREGKMLDYVASHRPDAQAWVKQNGYT